jgi:hypothetical protein
MPPSTISPRSLHNLPVSSKDDDYTWAPFDESDWDNAIKENDVLDFKTRVFDRSSPKKSTRGPGSRRPLGLSSSLTSSSSSPGVLDGKDQQGTIEDFVVAPVGVTVRRSFGMNTSSNRGQSNHVRSTSPKRHGASRTKCSEQQRSKAVAHTGCSPPSERNKQNKCEDSDCESIPDQGSSRSLRANRHSATRSSRRSDIERSDVPKRSSSPSRRSRNSDARSPRRSDKGRSDVLRRSRSPPRRNRIARTLSKDNPISAGEQTSNYLRRQMVARTYSDELGRFGLQHRRSISLSLARSQTLSVRGNRSSIRGEAPTISRQRSLRGSRISHELSPPMQRQHSLRASRGKARDLSPPVPVEGRHSTITSNTTAARVPRSDRLKKQLPRKCLSFDETCEKSARVIQRLGLDKVPSKRQLQASEHSSPESAPIRRTKSMGIKAGATAPEGRRLAGTSHSRGSRRHLMRTKTEERRHANSRFVETCESTMKAFVPDSFENGEADPTTSTLKDKVSRMKEISKDFAKPPPNEEEGAGGSPRMRRADAAKSA